MHTLTDGIRKETLDNGLILLSERMPKIRSVALGVWLRKGSRHEIPDENGISHFIEHLLFKGTETWTAQDIALTIDSVGVAGLRNRTAVVVSGQGCQINRGY